MADGADAEMAALESLTDPRNAVVPEAYSDALAGVVPGAALDGPRRASCRLRRISKNTVFSAPAKGLLVFSEVHYPEGWQLTIDGEPADFAACELCPAWHGRACWRAYR